MSSRNRFRHFALGGMAAAAALCALWLAAVASLEGRAHAGNQWIEQVQTRKRAIAQQLDGPRALVVSGSSALFGVDSKMLEQALGRPVANLATNAGLLAPYLIDEARRALRPGDWVIVPLEYPLFHDEGEVNEAFIHYYASHPLPAAQLGWWRWLKTMWLLPLQRIVEGHRGLPDGFVVRGTYGAHNLDDHGDQANSTRARRTPAMLAELKAKPAKTYGQQAWRGNASWTRWRRFAQDVRALGGCAVFVPPALLRREAYRSDAVEQRYYSLLPQEARAHGLVYVGAPFDFMYEEDQFFDTIYHLTSEARPGYTRQLIQALAQVSWRDCALK